MPFTGNRVYYSARYAGENCSFEDNMNKVLAAMEGIEDRKATIQNSDRPG